MAPERTTSTWRRLKAWACRFSLPSDATPTQVAEHALVLIKDLRRQDAFVRSGGWEDKSYHGHELRGRKLGLVGLGMIGRALAGMAVPIGMTVEAYDPFAPAEAFGPDATRVTDLDALLAESDVVSLHCPLTEQTRNLIGARELARMKPTAFLINTARGGGCGRARAREGARVRRDRRRRARQLRARTAGSGQPLWKLPNIIVSPHIAGVTEEARREVSLQTVRNVLAFLKNEGVHPRYFVRA